MAISNHHLHSQFLQTLRSPRIVRSRSIRRGRRTARIVAARKAIEGVSDELNAIAIAMGILDLASSRRRVREAFVDIHQNLDHFCSRVIAGPKRSREESTCDGFNTTWQHILTQKFGLMVKEWIIGSNRNTNGGGVANGIAAAGYGVYAMDYPGFGLSQGLYGYILSFDKMVNYVIEQYALIRAMDQVRGLPHFLLGQSMGGAVALNAYLKQLKEWDGVLLAAPMCKAEFNVISYSDQMRLKTAVELIKATQDIESKLDKVSSPLLILHGAADKVTDPKVRQLQLKIKLSSCMKKAITPF